MTKDYLQKVYEYLNGKWAEYYAHPKEKERIERMVQLYSHNMNEELYLILNEGRAAGLYGHGHFESDMLRSFAKLTELLN